MPFNSSINTHGYQKPIKNYSYDSDYLEDDLQVLPLRQLTYKPRQTELVSYIQDVPAEGAGIGKVIRKTANRVARSVKKSVIDKDGIGRKIISQVIDHTVPIVSGVAGQVILGDADAGMKFGERGRDYFKEKTGYGVGKTIRRTAKRVARQVKQSFTDKNGIGKKFVTDTINEYVPEVTNRLGKAIGDAGASAEIVDIARGMLKDKTGYGAPKKHVGKAKLSTLVSKYAPDYQTDIRPSSTAVVVPAKKGRRHNQRNALVKQVMKEQGLSLPEASRFIKENQLY